MQRITGANVASNLHGAGKHGFRERVPGVSAPTIVTADFANNVQEELCRSVEGYGFTLGTSNHQLLNVARCAAVESAVITHAPRTGANTFGHSYVCMAVSSSGVIVAGASVGYIDRSTTGASWTLHQAGSGSTGSFAGATWSDALGLFVLVGTGGEIQTSPDGTTWTKRTQGSGYAGVFWCAAYGNGLLLIAGTGGEIQTSPNGSQWTKRTQDNSYAGQFGGAAYGNGVYVLCGTGGEIQSSANGTSWTKRTPDAGFTGSFTSAFYAGGLFVLVGSGGEIQTSANGTDWTRRRPAVWTTLNFSSVSARNGAGSEGTVFFAAGENGLMAISADAVDWRLLYRPARFSEWLRCSVYHPNTATFIAGGFAATLRQTLAV